MNATDFSGHFSLGMLARVTEKFVSPAGEFDPAGEWVNRYALYCLIHNNRRKPVYGIRVGSLRLARRLSSARQARLEFDYRMVVAPDRSHQLAGSLLCARDELATPLEWDYRAEFSSPLAGRPEPALRIRHTMQVRGENLVMNAAGSSRRLARPQRYSCLWALFDAVQRLPRDSAKPVRFTFLDRHYTPRADHRLRYRESVEVPLGGAPLRLHGFEQLGEGLIPSLYWTDEAGRLLMCSFGIHGYVWEGGE